MADETTGVLPEALEEFMSEANANAEKGQPFSVAKLRTAFGDQDYNSLIAGNITEVRTRSGDTGYLGVSLDSSGQRVMAVAAAVKRQPGKSMDLLDQVKDFATITDNSSRDQMLRLVNTIYASEGMVNTAIQKSASLIATEGSFKVLSIRGTKGKSAEKAEAELLNLLEWWVDNVNSKSDDSIVTGDRGISSFISQGARSALIEGDHIGRQVWSTTEVPSLKKRYNLPMNLQTIPVAEVEVPTELEDFNLELVYWKPPRTVIQTLQNPRDENLKEYIEKYMEPEVLNALQTDGQYLLDPSLLFHVRHRGRAVGFWGESMIVPAMTEVAYKRSLQALDIVTIENLINRLVIIMVGSDDPNSIYHSAEVSAERLALMQRLMSTIGPAATVIWPGPDIKVAEIGAHDGILDTDERYKQVESRIRNALGVPAALLSGESSSGKAAGWAATIGLAAQLRELQLQYKNMLITIGQRIALENNFKDVTVTWEFHQDLLTDKEANAAMALKEYAAGLISAETALEEMGMDYQTELPRMLAEVAEGWRERPFQPPPITPSQMQQDVDPQGRPTEEERPGETDPREDTEQLDSEEAQ